MRGQWNISPVPPLSYLDYRDLRERTTASAGMLAYHHDWITLTRQEQRRSASIVANVSSNFFDVLGVKPSWAVFSARRRNASRWRRSLRGSELLAVEEQLGGDPAIVGKSIEIARHPER